MPQFHGMHDTWVLLGTRKLVGGEPRRNAHLTLMVGLPQGLPQNGWELNPMPLIQPRASFWRWAMTRDLLVPQPIDVGQVKANRACPHHPRHDLHILLHDHPPRVAVLVKGAWGVEFSAYILELSAPLLPLSTAWAYHVLFLYVPSLGDCLNESRRGEIKCKHAMSIEVNSI